MKKILIGTHNQGKFKEISYLISKKFKKISPNRLQIKSPKETGKTFISNSKLKAEYLRGLLAILVLAVCAKLFTDLVLQPNDLFSTQVL